MLPEGSYLNFQVFPQKIKSKNNCLPVFVQETYEKHMVEMYLPIISQYYRVVARCLNVNHPIKMADAFYMLLEK
jgi:hypothetical protein